MNTWNKVKDQAAEEILKEETFCEIDGKKVIAIRKADVCKVIAEVTTGDSYIIYQGKKAVNILAVVISGRVVYADETYVSAESPQVEDSSIDFVCFE